MSVLLWVKFSLQGGVVEPEQGANRRFDGVLDPAANNDQDTPQFFREHYENLS